MDAVSATIAILVTIFALGLIFYAAVMKLGFRLAGVRDLSWRRAVAVSVGVLSARVSALWLVSRAMTVETVGEHALRLAILSGVDLAIVCVGVQAALGRKVWGWLLSAALMLPVGFGCLFLLKSYVIEAFVAETVSMAPTLVGRHRGGTCPECGATRYAYQPRNPYEAREEANAICANFHLTKLSGPAEPAHPKDQFLSLKLTSPRRWDLVTFRLPRQPSTQYVKRLVGLPGETVVIKDGAVWIDGRRQTPPPAAAGLRHEDDLPDLGRRTVWGTERDPAVLGDDEYFVLGDFTLQSNDSRLWQSGAEGHNPYAVPASHITGVVTLTHWPPSRWRRHR